MLQLNHGRCDGDTSVQIYKLNILWTKWDPSEIILFQMWNSSGTVPADLASQMVHVRCMCCLSHNFSTFHLHHMIVPQTPHCQQGKYSVISCYILRWPLQVNQRCHFQEKGGEVSVMEISIVLSLMIVSRKTIYSHIYKCFLKKSISVKL